jgi:hypothetical protein
MDTSEMNSDELFKYLPAVINDSTGTYGLHLHKFSTRNAVSYRTDKDENGHHIFLGNTSRSGKTLEVALRRMLNWLIEFGYYDNYEIENRDKTIDDLLDENRLSNLTPEVLLADIRNKLSPASNLIALIEMYMSGERTHEEMDYIKEEIKKGIPLAKESMEYVRNFEKIEL